MGDLDLLVLGDCNPDLVVRGGDLRPRFGQAEQLVDEARLVVGGSGAIMACGAARLGLRTASSPLGSRQSVCGSRAWSPPSHAPAGSQFGSTEVPRPSSLASRNRPARPGRSAACR